MALVVAALSPAMACSIAAAQEQPSITIVAPAEGDVLAGPAVTAEVAVSGFDLRPPLQEGREPNAGHIEYFLDVTPTFDQPQPLGDDRIIHSGRFSETFATVPPGQHTVSVCLAYDDHTCIDPALTDSVQVTVGEPPTVEPTLTPEATPEPPPPTVAPATAGAAAPAAPPSTPVVTPQPTLDGLTEETPSPTATATPSLGRQATPRPEPTFTPMAGLAPSTLADSSNARSVDWALALACVSVVGLVALGWLTLLAARRPSRRTP
jgi:hypothetical protein